MGGGREMVVRSVALRGWDTGARLGPEWSGAGWHSGTLRTLSQVRSKPWKPHTHTRKALVPGSLDRGPLPAPFPPSDLRSCGGGCAVLQVMKGQQAPNELAIHAEWRRGVCG